MIYSAIIPKLSAVQGTGLEGSSCCLRRCGEGNISEGVCLVQAGGPNAIFGSVCEVGGDVLRRGGQSIQLVNRCYSPTWARLVLAARLAATWMRWTPYPVKVVVLVASTAGGGHFRFGSLPGGGYRGRTSRPQAAG